MATDVGQQRGGKGATGARHESFARAQLAKAESRIRSLDLTAAICGFLAGTLAFAILMIVCDRRWELSAAVRQGAFIFYLAAAAIYLYATVVRTFRRRVNPYYAARRIEETVPEAKNSVINWVDLHESNLAPAITAAVGQRAARDLARADFDQAISGKKAAWSGGAAAICFGLFLTAFIIFGPRVFSSLFRRSFLPFEAGGIVTQTLLTLVKPETGDAVIPIGRSVTIAVHVAGRVPDPKGPNAVRLLYRHQEADPFIERPLQKESGEEWSITINAFDVQNGFWFKVVGGDAETDEYRITVRSTPLLTDFRANYHFRAYTARPDELRKDRRLEAVRGTEVTLRVKTNRQVKEAFADLEAGMDKKSFRAELLGSDPQGFQIQFKLEETGQYRLRYTSTDGEAYFDPTSFPITVNPDKAPDVELTNPGKDVTLPANGILNLEGSATDDFGVKSMVLRLQLVDGRKLEPKPYRSDKPLKLPGGGYPLAVEYKDFVELGKVHGPDGKLSAGTALEYWLEAEDACDYPKPNVGTSKHYRVTLIEPEKDQTQAQKERDKAEQDKKQHDAKQDEKLKKEDQARKEDAKRQEQENQNQDDPMGGGQQPSPKDKPGGKDGQPDKRDGANENKAPDNKKPDGDNAKPENGPNDPKNKDIEDKLKEELTKKDKQEQQKQDQPGANQGKNGQDNKNEGQDKGDNANDKNQPGGKQNPGNDNAQEKPKQQPDAKKGENKNDPQQGPGENKSAGQKENKPEKGDAKGDGAKKDGEKPGDPKQGGADGKQGQGTAKDQTAKPGQESKAAEKNNEQKPMAGGQPGQAKDEGKGEPDPKQGDNKAGDKPGQPMGGDKVGEDKPGPKDDQPGRQGDGKAAGEKGKDADGKPNGEAKAQPGKPDKSEGKDARDVAGSKEAKAAPRDARNKPMNGNGQDQPGKDKQAPEKSDDKTVAKGQPKGDMKPGGEPKERRDNLADNPEQIGKLMRDLKSADPKDRERAAERLKNMTDEEFKDLEQAVKDLLEGKKSTPESRKRERETRDEAEGKAVAVSKPTASKDGKGEENDPSPMKKDGAGSKENGTAEAKASKPGGDEKAKGEPKDGGPKDGKGDAEGSDGKTAGRPGTAKNKGTPPDGDPTPGQGPPQTGGRADGDPGAPEPRPEFKPEPGDARFRRRAGVLQLEEFKHKVDKKVLKDTNISEEDYRAFLKAYEEMLKRQPDKANGNEDLAPPQTGSTLPSVGARRVTPTGKADDVKSSGRPQPPARYREAYREFTRQLAAPEKTNNK